MARGDQTGCERRSKAAIGRMAVLVAPIARAMLRGRPAARPAEVAGHSTTKFTALQANDKVAIIDRLGTGDCSPSAWLP